MKKNLMPMEQLIVNSPAGFGLVEEGLRPVTLTTLEDLAKVARIRSLPILHHRSELHSMVLEDHVVLDVQAGVIYRLGRTRTLPGG